ncbi:hypothetical protein L615_000700000550 [Nocardioides sp. J9]|uniref:hypothetical protein n=1 Tax=unclassified Nocardioides TaxID=2615069 RepID=UPI00048F84B1|nr:MULTISPECIES: hypothetical protein [unclassified Nocardioides]TWG92648.1 hypothetical protein L615_000700000550 [Nocardioides sp. J9]
MKPLQAVGLGLVLIALGPVEAEPGTFDPLPDPLGWFLVLVGLHGVGPSLDERRLPLLRLLGGLAFVVSVALVVPTVARWLETDPSLGWAADVPRFAFFALVCHELSQAALRARATGGASSFSIAALTLLFVLAAPPLAFGAGWDGVGTAGEVAAQAVQIALVVLCFVFAGRRWAGAPEVDAPEAPAA